MSKIAIIGAGPAGLFAAYSLHEDNNITIFEKGNPLDKRKCPARNGVQCINCVNCNIMEGVAGAGAFSDGKYNITTDYGGWLNAFVPKDLLLEYIGMADNILCENCPVYIKLYEPDEELKLRCAKNNLNMLTAKVRHFGTEYNFATMSKLVEYLEKVGVKLLTNTEVLDIQDKQLHYLNKEKEAFEEFDIIIIAVGRAGSEDFTSWCQDNNVQVCNNQVDLGVRVELPRIIWKEFEEKIYEPKITYRTKQYEDNVRMFCFNGGGEVVTENVDGVITVNGHAYCDEDKKTNNTNFALLSTTNFTEPFHDPIRYAKYVAELSNIISDNNIIVQRLGDLRRGRRTTRSRLDKNTVVPTLKSAVPGDLSLCMPKRQLDNIIEMLDALNNVAPGTNNDDVLLYGIECKYYSSRPVTDKDFMIYDDVYAIGDGAGFTRGLAQACAQGLIVGDNIKRKQGKTPYFTR